MTEENDTFESLIQEEVLVRMKIAEDLLRERIPEDKRAVIHLEIEALVRQHFVEVVAAAVRPLRDRYQRQIQFADIEAASYFREFVEALNRLARNPK